MSFGNSQIISSAGSSTQPTAPGPAPSIPDVVDGTELGYAQITSNFGLSTGGVVDVPGLTITINVGTRPIKLIFDCHAAQIGTAGNFSIITINEGATVLAEVQFGLGAINEVYPAHREVRLTPTPGAHTYKIQAGIQGGTQAANDRIQALPTSPAFIQAIAL